MCSSLSDPRFVSHVLSRFCTYTRTHTRAYKTYKKCMGQESGQRQNRNTSCTPEKKRLNIHLPWIVRIPRDSFFTPKSCLLTPQDSSSTPSHVFNLRRHCIFSSGRRRMSKKEEMGRGEKETPNIHSRKLYFSPWVLRISMLMVVVCSSLVKKNKKKKK